MQRDRLLRWKLATHKELDIFLLPLTVFWLSSFNLAPKTVEAFQEHKQHSMNQYARHQTKRTLTTCCLVFYHRPAPVHKTSTINFPEGSRLKVLLGEFCCLKDDFPSSRFPSSQTIYRILFVYPVICFPQTYHDSTAFENVTALTNLGLIRQWVEEQLGCTHTRNLITVALFL